MKKKVEIDTDPVDEAEDVDQDDDEHDEFSDLSAWQPRRSGDNG